MLLSVIIPTKNRQDTALFAIESALAVHPQDVEVVVQDCSDTNILEQQIADKFGKDIRIKYQYTNKKPSMTENWNMAFNRASGEYLCGIGDDDAVLPFIYTQCEWARKTGIPAVVQKDYVTYLWPGFVPQKYNGTLSFKKKYSAEKEIISDLHRKVADYCELIDPMGFIKLPQAYHTIFSGRIKDQLIGSTGLFLQSTSLDIYTAIAFNKYISTYAEVDLPFTIRGANKQSNTQRLAENDVEAHFKEFKDIVYPGILPATTSLSVSAAEALIKACETTDQPELIQYINLPILYANIALENENSFDLCVSKLNEYVRDDKEKKKFFEHYRKRKEKTSTKSPLGFFFLFIKKKLRFAHTLYRKVFPNKNFRKIVPAATIKEAIVILQRSTRND